MANTQKRNYRSNKYRFNSGRSKTPKNSADNNKKKTDSRIKAKSVIAAKAKAKPKTGSRSKGRAGENSVPYRVIPLGGMKEIGKNCTLIECNNEILIIDCGFAFPEYEMFGIDIVIPDFTYLKENMEKVRGLIITHGHEDHIGGVPYLLQDINVPIYAAPLAMGMINHKLEENGLSAERHVIKAGDTFKCGSFRIEAIQTNHSIADSLAYSIKFPGGHVFHTGDFKIDYSPIDGKVIDLNRFSELGNEGVDLLLCDSTNVMRKGYTPSEAVVRKSIDDIFNNTEQRIIIATFSSNVHRIRYFMEASMKHNRRIAVSGRSMENVLTLAKDLGYLENIPDSVFVKISDIKNIPDRNLTIITTGSQGEPMSALTRMANDNHKSVKLKKNDVVVFSSSPIPGNEMGISQVVNQLYEKGVNVVLASAMDVHVSGHASSEELKLIHTLLRPRFFIPAHGEYRHLIEHARLAQSLGQPANHIFVLGNGDSLEIEGSRAHIAREFTSGEDVMVDGSGIGDVGSAVLKDRKTLSQSGLITIAVALDSAEGSLMAVPELRTRGFVYVAEHQDLLKEAVDIVYNTIGRCTNEHALDEASLSKAIKSDMKSFIYKKTKRNPVIIPIILYV
ncbi:MAG: ribonuclease J [Mogibacterium sp.]|nr:ribonuclease J [Mogibacterium sp.]